MTRPSRKLTLLVPLLLAAVALGACGDTSERVTTGTYAGESGQNAPYLSVGPLRYEVQVSRQLNPFSTEDSAYLQGLTPLQRTLLPGQLWFGVFLQVFNRHPVPLPATTAISISDTQGNVYLPIVPSATNLYAYRGGLVPAEDRLPLADSPAGFGPTQGALVLFKISIASLDNRPIEIKIRNQSNLAELASAELDV
jgi:hypothetical protein